MEMLMAYKCEPVAEMLTIPVAEMLTVPVTEMLAA